MLYPDVDDLLASILDTFERYVAPAVDDEYAVSLCLTIGQLLRSVRARIAHEGDALAADNAELRTLLHELRPVLDGATPAATALTEVDTRALAPDQYVDPGLLRAESARLRGLLVTCIEALPDREQPERAAIREYLRHHLDRQRPWLVDAFTGPRR
jgi:hypothetical protein